MSQKIYIGTRASDLALQQTLQVKSALIELDIMPKDSIEIVPIVTSGDKFADANLTQIGGKGLFVKEIEEALLERKIDIAVHSLKDVPGQISPHSDIKAVLKREDPRDILITREGFSLKTLQIGALIGTSSPRRQAQLLSIRPDLKVTYFRGNIKTRLTKLENGEVDAILLAIAGIKRLDLRDIKYEILSEQTMLPAIGQGAIGLQIRVDDTYIGSLVEKINHLQTFIETSTERSFLQALEATCLSPIAALAKIEGDLVNFKYMITTKDNQIYRHEVSLPLGDHLLEAYKIGLSLKPILKI